MKVEEESKEGVNLKFKNVDIRFVQARAVMSRSQLLKKKPFMINGTIKDNIDPGFIFKFKEIVEALNIAGIEEIYSNY